MHGPIREERNNETVEVVGDRGSRAGTGIVLGGPARRCRQWSAVDAASGDVGRRVPMLGFSPRYLARIHAIRRLVGLEARRGVETAIVVSSPAAQPQIHAGPVDCHLFERVNIESATHEEACRVLSDLIRDKALATIEGEILRLSQVTFGLYPETLYRDNLVFDAGTSVSWDAASIRAGAVELVTVSGAARSLTWDEVADSPGWCKLDWVVEDPVGRRVANAISVIEATWEAPDGTLAPLDGFLDPYSREVHLEERSIPLFANVAEVSAVALDAYAERLESQVRTYVGREPKNFGKAAMRMYNIFRLRGLYAEAKAVRELFDEPARVLYRVWSLLHSLDEAADPDSSTERRAVLAEADELIASVSRTLGGDEEADVITHLLRLREGIRREPCLDGRCESISSAREKVVLLVNDFFYDRLTAVPSLRDYVVAVELGL
ncbi:hypothetical protein ACFLRH_01760 [Actinomycetota bacterium]